jgi:5-formyltetrahydrofolate cyclo-ligase
MSGYNSQMTDGEVLTKDQLRLVNKRIREAKTAEEHGLASEEICRHIGGWRLFQEAATILIYLPMRNEVDLTALIAVDLQKNWVVPRIQPQGQMVYHIYDSSRLVRHKYGMLEPASDCPLVSPVDIQLAFVPGLTFDREGWRLGYGGGFYDRFLSGFKGWSAGITYENLYVERVPYDSHDIAVDFVITETGIKTVS